MTPRQVYHQIRQLSHVRCVLCLQPGISQIVTGANQLTPGPVVRADRGESWDEPRAYSVRCREHMATAE